jgi:hypothetical protein
VCADDAKWKHRAFAPHKPGKRPSDVAETNEGDPQNPSFSTME